MYHINTLTGFLNRCQGNYCTHNEVPHYKNKDSNSQYKAYKYYQKLKKNTLVLSDVDGTLVKGSLVLNHAKYLHDKKIINLGKLPDAWVSDMKNETIIRKLAEAYRESITGKTLKELDINNYMGSLQKNNFYTTFSQIKKMKNYGAKVVLISGSPDYLVKKLAKSSGFIGIGSKYHTDPETKQLTGTVDGMFHAEAKEKVVNGLIRKYNSSRVVAYGDTSSDKPLFDVADNRILVAPTKETLNLLGISPKDKNYKIITR